MTENHVEYDYDHYSMDIQYDRRDNIYVVTVHELSESSNCQTHGKTYEEAVSQGRDLIETVLDVRKELGLPIPQPRYLDLEPDQQGDDDGDWGDEEEGEDEDVGEDTWEVGPPILPAVNIEYDYDHYSMDIQYDRRSGSYIVTVHEFRELNNRTHGKTYEEAVSQGRDLIATWLDFSYESGYPIPQPRYFDLEPDQQGDDVEWEWDDDDEEGDASSRGKNVA